MNKQIIGTFGAFCLAASAQADAGLEAEHTLEFVNYQAEYGKWPTTSAEFKRCKKNFEESARRINKCNRDAEKKGDKDAVHCQHNFTSDMDDDEYANHLGLINEQPNDNSEGRLLDDISEDDSEDSDASEDESEDEFDDEGFLSGGRLLSDGIARASIDHTRHMVPVKSQGGCGSCWAFAATSALEGTIAKKLKRSPVRLSEQQAVDCMTNTDANKAIFGKTYGMGGCRGGWMSSHWKFMKEQGVMLESDYEYTGKGNELCKHDEELTVGRVDTWGSVPMSTKKFNRVLKQRVRQQPVSIALDASSSGFRFYKSGVLKKSDCTNGLNHGVVIMGYQNKKKADAQGDANYWKVQNSWGAKWGDNGYIKLQIAGKDGTCAMNKYAQFVEWNVDSETN